MNEAQPLASEDHHYKEGDTVTTLFNTHSLASSLCAFLREVRESDTHLPNSQVSNLGDLI